MHKTTTSSRRHDDKRVFSEGTKKKKVIGSSVVRDRLIFGRRSRPKMACLGRIIRSLAFNVIRQTASKATLVPKSICAGFGTLGMVLEEATSTRDSILPTQLGRAYRMASIKSEREATCYDCQPSTFNLTWLCHIPLPSQRSTRLGRPLTTRPIGRNVKSLTRITKIKHKPEMLEAR